MWWQLPDDTKFRLSEAADVFADAVQGFDPTSASKAQTSMMQAELTKFAGRLAEAEASVRRDQRELTALQASYDRYLDAARRLERSVRNGQDHAGTREREVSLSRLIEHLERMKPELRCGRDEDEQAGIPIVGLRATFAALSTKLRQAEEVVDTGSPSRTTLPVSKGTYSARSTKRSALSDLTAALSSISVTLDLVNKETARMRAENEPSTSRTESFEGGLLEHDPYIAAALDVAWHGPPPNGRSLRDRLNSLEDRTVAPSAPATASREVKAQSLSNVRT